MIKSVKNRVRERQAAEQRERQELEQGRGGGVMAIIISTSLPSTKKKKICILLKILGIVLHSHQIYDVRLEEGSCIHFSEI